MSKFKVGDRVALYSMTRKTGTIIVPDNNDYPGCLQVSTDEGIYIAHPNQCRKLVKAKRERIWVLVRGERSTSKAFRSTDALLNWFEMEPHPDRAHQFVEYIKVRKGNK